MKYRTRPFHVTAVRFWMPTERPKSGGPDPNIPGLTWYDFGSTQQHPCVVTQFGRFSIKDGDWIVTNASGVFYPCKHEIFREMFDPVFEPDASAAQKIQEVIEAFPIGAPITIGGCRDGLDDEGLGDQ